MSYDIHSNEQEKNDHYIDLIQFTVERTLKNSQNYKQVKDRIVYFFEKMGIDGHPFTDNIYFRITMNMTEEEFQKLYKNLIVPIYNDQWKITQVTTDSVRYAYIAEKQDEKNSSHRCGIEES